MQPRIIGGKYEIVRELSQGGMGAVYEARHLLTRRKVAVKLVLAETLARKRPSDALRRFEREARAAGSIESRHVVSVLDTGIDAVTNDHYIVMELLSGLDLRELVRREGKLAPELVLAIAFQVCHGLRRAHEQGIVHRDIKAGNIFLARRDDGEVEVKILDFGIAKLRVDPLAASDGHDLTRSGSVLGSPLYMSPEQATGSREVDARSDIWSLGVVMYEALAGATPHAHRALGAVILAICSEPPRPLRERAPWVSAEVAAIVHKALALEPARRYASAEEMQAAIEAQLPGGALIHGSALDTIAGAPPDEARSNTPAPVSDESSPPPAQTTVDAVTYGSGAAKHGTSARTRRLGRRLTVLGSVGVLAAIVLSWRVRGGSLSEPTPSSSSTPARAPETAPTPPAPSRPAAASTPTANPAFDRKDENQPLSSQPAAVERSRRFAVRTPRVTERPATSSVASVTPSAPPARIVTPPPAGNEPAIDRHFD